VIAFNANSGKRISTSVDNEKIAGGTATLLFIKIFFHEGKCWRKA
jgi:hypothetical protein